MKIKICGIKNLEEISYINEANPDYAGFIFAPQSKRRISLESAKKLKNALNKSVKSAGVFVDSPIELISDVINNGIIDIIQLHGHEDNAYIEELKTKTNLPVIKAYTAEKGLEKKINTTIADYILIDNGAGGTGQTFDWNLVPETNKKIFLAGGLNADNIIQAINAVHPYCVDINSSVETNGQKDRNKILEIIEKIKGLENEQH